MNSPLPTVRRRAAVVFASLALFAAGAAEAAPFRLTSPATATFDDWPAVVPVDTGFELAFQHYEQTGLSSIQIRRFAADGKPVGNAKQIAAPAPLIGHPRLLRARSGKLGLTWLDPVTGINGTTIDTATGAVAKPLALAKPSAAFYDVARLSNDNIAATYVYLDTSNVSSIRVRAAVSLATPTFGTIAKNAKLPASDNPFTTPGSPDQTVVGDGAGGALAFYRDRTDGNLYVVKVSSKGVPATTRTRVNVAAMKVGTPNEMAGFGVQAVRLTDGRYAVVWNSIETTDLSKSTLRLRWLDATGLPIGAAVAVNATATGVQLSPRLAALAGARLAVAWIQDQGVTRYHRLRWYAAAGTPLTTVQTLRSDTEVWDPAGLQMTKMPDGRVLQVWRAMDSTTRRYHIRGEFLTPPL